MYNNIYILFQFTNTYIRSNMRKPSRPSRSSKPSKPSKELSRPNEHKMCPIIWDRGKYSIIILTMDNAHARHYTDKSVYYVPLRTFMQCSELWDALNLSTIFWEPPLYGIPRDYLENERIKGSYLIAFASDLAPICKEWAKGCIEHCRNCHQTADDEAFVEIILFNESRKSKIVYAISRHNISAI